MLSKKKYTYNFDGEIIFIKRFDNDRLPATIYQPKYGTKLKPIQYVPENTIHKFQNKDISAEEYVEKHFKPEEPKPEVKERIGNRVIYICLIDYRDANLKSKANILRMWLNQEDQILTT